MTENQKSESGAPGNDEIATRIQSMRKRMLMVLAICLVVMVTVSFYFTTRYATPQFAIAYHLGGLIGIVNGIIGFLTIEKFIDKSNLAFLKGVFLGMGVRLLLLLGIFVLLVKVFDVHVIGLVVGLIVFYFAMTIFEVLFLNKRIGIKRTVGA